MANRPRDENWALESWYTIVQQPYLAQVDDTLFLFFSTHAP